MVTGVDEYINGIIFKGVLHRFGIKTFAHLAISAMQIIEVMWSEDDLKVRGRSSFDQYRKKRRERLHKKIVLFGLVCQLERVLTLLGFPSASPMMRTRIHISFRTASSMDTLEKNIKYYHTLEQKQHKGCSFPRGAHDIGQKSVREQTEMECNWAQKEHVSRSTRISVGGKMNM